MTEEEEEIKDKQVGDYTLSDELGSGGFGKVVLGTHIPTGEKVAIKIMNKEQIMSDELNKERVLNEISILKIVRHNNIIKLYEVMETPQKIYLVMEYCDNGEMFDYIVSKQHLTEKQACVFFQEIIDALTYLHSQNIVHRDVKPENILLQTFGNTLTCKLIDFGISRTYTLDKLITTPCGTASYAPPEMHRGEEYYGLLSDVWSAGVLLYAMCFGYLPFCEEDEDTNIDNIINGNYEIPEEASPQLEDLIRHIMDIDPLTRYDLDQIKKHPWYNLVTPPKCYPGLIIGYHKIPIDERILKVCEAYGFNKDEVENSVKENKYDNKSAIYYIILAKMKREGYDSISDLFSQEYLNYINNKDNILPKKKESDKEKDDKENNDNKQKGLDILNDVLKSEKEEKENNNLEQISNENIIKQNNESKDEISVASEKEKNNIEDNNKENEIKNDLLSKKVESKNLSKKSSKRSLNKEEENNKNKSSDKIQTSDALLNLDSKDKIHENKNENEIQIKTNKEEIEKEKISEINQTKERIEDNKMNIIQNPENEIKLPKEKENIIEISKPETKEDKKTLITLNEKIEPEKDTIIITQESIKPNAKEKEVLRNKVLVPKHSFYINMNTKKLLLNQESNTEEYNTENMNPNKLNSSFTLKLTDSLKENVFKMRNPKAKIPNKAQEINNALKEIKKNKAKKNKQKKEKKIKNIKIKKINEPLFKGNKKNEHTIIHNRNASAVNAERRKNKIDNKENNNKNKINKNTSTSMEKVNKKNIYNKNNDLKNNLKQIKSQYIKEKESKDKDKNNRGTSIEKRKTKKYNKFINKNVNNTMTVKKNENNITTSGTTLMTASNIKHNRIKSALNSSTNKKDELKTPSKNNKDNIEPFYKRLNSSNVNKNEIQNLTQTGNLNKALQLSEVKETKNISKFSHIKVTNQNHKKNIRLNYKNIEQEDFIKNDIEQKKTFRHYKVKSDFDLSYNNNHKNRSSEKRKINHIKSNSIEINNNSKANKFLNSYQNSHKASNQPYKEFIYKNSFKYPSMVKTDRNMNKIKKYINISSFEGPLKTEIQNEKKGYNKFWQKKQEEQIIKECYYKGPIDLKNIFFGNSIDEIQEILIGILIKNRIKYWKMNSFRFYCKKNGESFVIRIYILSDKIKTNNNGYLHISKEEIKVSEFDINKKEENEEIKINEDNNINSINKICEDKGDKCMIFYVCVLSKESNNKSQARQINKIINKKLSEIFKK